MLVAMSHGDDDATFSAFGFWHYHVCMVELLSCSSNKFYGASISDSTKQKAVTVRCKNYHRKGAGKNWSSSAS
jgi:hypothetical protein